MRVLEYICTQIYETVECRYSTGDINPKYKTIVWFQTLIYGVRSPLAIYDIVILDCIMH